MFFLFFTFFVKLNLGWVLECMSVFEVAMECCDLFGKAFGNGVDRRVGIHCLPLSQGVWAMTQLAFAVQFPGLHLPGSKTERQ